MRKRIFLMVAMVIALACLLCVSAFAAEPDANGEKVTLGNGTVLPIWDTDGDALIWYVSTDNTEDGYADYDYVKAQSSEVDYKTSWTDGTQNQVGTVTITVNGNTYDKNDFVVLNLKDEDVLVTTSAHGRVGKPVNCFASAFTSSTTLEYVYLRLDTITLQASNFSGCTNLKYINISELEQLKIMGSQQFTNCTSLFEGQAIDLSKTKLTSLSSGVFNNVPAASIIFPETLTRLENWSLQALTKVKEIHIPENITFFGATMFKNCYELERVTGYKALFERGVISTIQENTFLDCKALTSVDFPDSFTSIGGSALRGTLSLTGTFRIPDECTSIGGSAFQDSGFETIIVGKGITTIPSNVFRASKLKSIFISTYVTKIEQEAFRDMKNKVVVYYTGSDVDSLRAITVHSYNGVIMDASTVCVSASEFDYENKQDKHYVVYGYNFCDALYNGQHDMSNGLKMQLTSYFDKITFACVCAREECKNAVTDESKTINPIFKYMGYSCTEVAIGGAYSITQGYVIDGVALDKYREINPDFTYGFVASGVANPLAPENSDLVEAGKVIVIPCSFVAHSYVEIKLNGISDNDEAKAKALVFCLFVEDNGISYLDGGTTSDSVNGITYNEILNIVKERV